MQALGFRGREAQLNRFAPAFVMWRISVSIFIAWPFSCSRRRDSAPRQFPCPASTWLPSSFGSSARRRPLPRIWRLTSHGDGLSDRRCESSGWPAPTSSKGFQSMGSISACTSPSVVQNSVHNVVDAQCSASAASGPPEATRWRAAADS